MLAVFFDNDPGHYDMEKKMKILVGYDGTNAAREALSVAIKHARAFGAESEIVTSLLGGEDTGQKEIDEAEGGLVYAKEQFDSKGLKCETRLLVRGMSPGEDIVRYADENGFDEIIVGVKRRSRVGKILMGSTAQYIIIRAKCPVVAVK